MTEKGLAEKIAEFINGNIDFHSKLIFSNKFADNLESLAKGEHSEVAPELLQGASREDLLNLAFYIRIDIAARQNHDAKEVIKLFDNCPEEVYKNNPDVPIVMKNPDTQEYASFKELNPYVAEEKEEAEKEGNLSFIDTYSNICHSFFPEYTKNDVAVRDAWSNLQRKVEKELKNNFDKSNPLSPQEELEKHLQGIREQATKEGQAMRKSGLEEKKDNIVSPPTSRGKVENSYTLKK
jgi:hypothetical protein